jgi:hypothetical protein
MLADDVLAAAGGEADRLFRGGVSALADDVRRAARYDLTQGVMLSAQTVHRSEQSPRIRALPLCRLPFERTWFEWPGGAPDGAAPTVAGPARYAPVPRRCGALVTVDDSRQRGVMTWAWYTKDQGLGINMSPLSVVFDWREEPEPIEDLHDQTLRRWGFDKAEADRLGQEAAYREIPRTRSVAPEALQRDRDRFGFVWSPYVERFARSYERDNGPIDPTHPLWQGSIGDITGEPAMLQCVILLLNSRNMTAAEAVPAPERLNRQRARKGKLPLLDYTTIRIKLSRTLSARAGSTGDRASSRFHIVSGHFKVRKTGIYWWSDFSRGDPTKGIVRQQTRKVTA